MQLAQSVAPSAPLYLPASHLVQVADPSEAEKPPAAQEVQLAEAVDAAVPAGHILQVVAPSPELVPASHAEQYTDTAAAWW